MLSAGKETTNKSPAHVRGGDLLISTRKFKIFWYGPSYVPIGIRTETLGFLFLCLFVFH
jgi:hypothetical protein